jgi:hypothetical protein
MEKYKKKSDLENLTISELNDILYDDLEIQENLMRPFDYDGLYLTFGDDTIEMATHFLKCKDDLVYPEYFYIDENTRSALVFGDYEKAREHILQIVIDELGIKE